MSSSISSFRSRRRTLSGAGPALLTLAILAIANLAVTWLPAGKYQRAFEASVQLTKLDADANAVLFGDSRSTVLRAQFFEEEVLSLAAPNNTVIFSKLLYDRMLADTQLRPRIVFLMVGANNYNKNGIFTRRDFAIRRLATLSDLLDFLDFPDGLSFALDGLFSKCFPIYGRRMEIRSVQQLYHILRRGWGLPLGATDVQGMTAVKARELAATPQRSEVADKNYLMIYQRSVYVNYALSGVHTGILEALIDKVVANGAEVVVVQLPVEPVIRELERKAVGTIFDDYLQDLRQRKRILHLDLRKDTRFEFADLNHLSLRGGREFTEEILNPLVAAAVKTDSPH